MTMTDKSAQAADFATETDAERATRVARIRQAIAAGTYVVTPDAVAAALIDRSEIAPPDAE